jgi:hypothetical protein
MVYRNTSLTNITTKNPKVNYIFTEHSDGPFLDEANDLKTFLAKYYPEEQVQVVGGYGKDFFNKQVTPILKNQIDSNDRFFLFGHHGSMYAGTPNNRWGELLELAQKRAGPFNCYLGSCFSEDLFLNPENRKRNEKYGEPPVFDKVGNFYYRPTNAWLGVNPNAPKGKNSDEGILGAMFSTTSGSPEINIEEIFESMTDLRSKIRNDFREKNKKIFEEFENFKPEGKTREEVNAHLRKRNELFKEEEKIINSNKQYNKLRTAYQKFHNPYIQGSLREGYDYSSSTSLPKFTTPTIGDRQAVYYQKGGFFRNLFEGVGDFFKGIFSGKGGRGSFACPGDVCSPGKIRFEKTGRSKFRESISNLFKANENSTSPTPVKETTSSNIVKEPKSSGSTGIDRSVPEWERVVPFNDPEKYPVAGHRACYDDFGNPLPFWYDENGVLVPCETSPFPRISITNYYNTPNNNIPNNPYQNITVPTDNNQDIFIPQKTSTVYEDAIVQSPEARGAGSFDMQGNFSSFQGNLARYGGIRTPNKRKKFRSY